MRFLQENAAQRWRQRERINHAQHNAKRNGERELVVQLPRNAWHHGGGNKHRKQHRASGDNRTRNFFHGALGRNLSVRRAKFKLPVHILNHNN